MINLNFQNACRPLMEQIHIFHDWLMVFLISISVGTLWSILIIRKSTMSNRALTESQTVEFIWTILPSLVLVAIGLPSLRLLYLVDEIGGASITVKALGHQWYWHYDYPDFPAFDSYIIRSDYRLLDTDHRLIFPMGHAVQILISAADVLHSWTIPTIAVKADAVPGRVNKLTLMPKRPGVFFGQCREICGRNHRFMPISIECYAFN